MNSFVDTRGLADTPLSFCQAIVTGIAPGGGLFVPQSIPALSVEQICALGQLPYAQRAARVYEAFDIDIPADDIASLMAGTYADNFDDERIAPVVPLGDNGTYVLELFHGPTSAFKDMALQCLPRCFEYATAKLRASGELDHDHLILVATSGDTGKAALEGFAGREHVGIVVFYPDGGVSDIQLRQMTTQEGANVGVFAARGDFDDCQTSVKRAFGDAAFCERLMSEHNVALSSANSINWGRLMPQIVYYLSAYADLVSAGSVHAGDAIDICVPTGNFGNILAAYYAMRIGLPVGRLVCASNENNVLTDFLTTGVYDITGRSLHLTPSPSMDILVSSNLERQLFELTDRNAERVRGWMEQLASTGRFEVDAETRERLGALYAAGFATNDECLAAIGRVFEEHGYVADPHTAVALEVARRNRSERPMLVASTAHWAKFGPAVWRGLHGMKLADELPADVAGLTGLELNRRIAAETGSSVPEALAALEGRARRFDTVVDATQAGVEASVLEWLARA
ncbi:MAG: threonine synthase [Coriobacteriia bacterium]|nr:threonine synthase [Coriobacteriia bacterium]MBS5479079.1 threonine synthase [Coriobacteriia bacterium]